MEISQSEGEMNCRLYYREDFPLIEGLTRFKYMGRIVEEMHSDWLATHQNTSKARTICRMLVKLLRREGVDSRL